MTDLSPKREAEIRSITQSWSPCMITGLLAEIDRLRIRTEALSALLQLHRCNSSGDMAVGDCVESGACRCCAGF